MIERPLLRSPFGALRLGNQLLNFPYFVFAIPGNSYRRIISHVACDWQLPTATAYTPDEASSAYGELSLYRFAGKGVPSGSYDPASAGQPLEPILGTSPTAQLLGHWRVTQFGFTLDAADLPTLEANADHAFVLSDFEYRNAAGNRVAIITSIARAFITVLGSNVDFEAATDRRALNYTAR